MEIREEHYVSKDALFGGCNCTVTPSLLRFQSIGAMEGNKSATGVTHPLSLSPL